MLHAPDTISPLDAGMQCQQCGRPLANPTAICTACDQELSTPIGGGRYRCPACHGLFDDWTTTLLPRNARWYTPPRELTTCPLCKEALQWKRDAEPAQLSASFQGIALGMLVALPSTIPTSLLKGVKEHLGTWFAILLFLLLIAMLFIAVRPSMLNTGEGAGHFVPVQAPPAGKPQFRACLITVVAITTSIWTAPQAAQLLLWCAWYGLAAAGCLAVVLWRRSAERHQRLQT